MRRHIRTCLGHHPALAVRVGAKGCVPGCFSLKRLYGLYHQIICSSYSSSSRYFPLYRRPPIRWLPDRNRSFGCQQNQRVSNRQSGGLRRELILTPMQRSIISLSIANILAASIACSRNFLRATSHSSHGRGNRPTNSTHFILMWCSQDLAVSLPRPLTVHALRFVCYFLAWVK